MATEGEKSPGAGGRKGEGVAEGSACGAHGREGLRCREGQKTDFPKRQSVHKWGRQISIILAFESERR